MSNNDSAEPYFCLTGSSRCPIPSSSRSSQVFTFAGTFAGHSVPTNAASIGFRYDVSADWLNLQYKSVQKLKKLCHNWNSYGADPPNHKAVYWCEETLREMNALGMREGRVSPSGEGGLAIVFRRDGKYADIELLNDGSILAVRKVEACPSEAWEVPADRGSLIEALSVIKSFLEK